MVATNFLARAAVLLVAVGHASALGTAVVHNSCDFDVYLWSVSDVSGSMEILSANGGEYSESYRNNPDGGGVSIKVGVDTFGLNVTQYEYTLEEKSVWYDLSLINGFPFVEYGVSVIPSITTCNTVICPAGVEACAAAYMLPSDNWATAECDSSADTVMMLCSGDESTGESPSASSAASSAAATATASTTTAVSVAPSTTSAAESTTSEAESTTESKTKTTTTVHHTTFTTHHHSTWTHKVDAPAATAKTSSTTAAPATTEAAAPADPNVVVHTTFVTYIVTVEARDAAPSPAPVAKRVDRHHRHEHGQQKRHEHGHVHHREDA